jgi:hypothetical protein
MKSIFSAPGRVFVWTLLLAVALAAATADDAPAQSWSAAAAPQECRRVTQDRAGFLEKCGDRINAWRLTLPFKREILGDLHGRIFFHCGIEPMCEGEPTIGGQFVPHAEWQAGARDEHAIFELAVGSSVQPLPPMPHPACPLFDVSFGGMTGRAVCFGEPGVNRSSVIVVAADDRVAFLLRFYQQDKSPDALKEKVVFEWLPRFVIERATGDAALLKWFR